MLIAHHKHFSSDISAIECHGDIFAFIILEQEVPPNNRIMKCNGSTANIYVGSAFNKLLFKFTTNESCGWC